jgi:hypothetical protein
MTNLLDEREAFYRPSPKCGLDMCAQWYVLYPTGPKVPPIPSPMLLNHTGYGFATFTDDELNAKLSALSADASPAPMRFFS